MEWRNLSAISALAFIFIILFVDSNTADEQKYLVVSPRIYRTGTKEVVAVTLFSLKERAVVVFEVKKNSKNIARKTVTFQPVDSGKTIQVFIQIPENAKTGYGDLSITASGGVNFKKKQSINIEKRKIEVFIQADKPAYKPGEKVQFRVVAVSPNLKPEKGKVSEISVENSAGSRIVQWKEKELDEGFVSLYFTLSKKPVLGMWKINANYKGVKRSLEIKVDKFVLPKFEVTIEDPSFIHHRRTKFPARICARYTYGKKVEGKLTATFCYKYKRIYRYMTIRQLPCFTISKLIDGCTNIDVSFNMGKNSIYAWRHVLSMHASVTETATGITLNGTKNASIVYDELKFVFQKTAEFKPGFKFSSQVSINTYDGKPALNKKINLQAKCCGNRKLLEIEKVVENGVLSFSVYPPSDAKTITLYAVHHMQDDFLSKYRRKLSRQQTVKSWYSPSKTFLVIEKPKEALQVGARSTIVVKFNPNSIRKNKIFYTLLCRGNIKDSGSVSDYQLNGNIAQRGISIFVTQEMVPKCRMLVYFVRTDGEFVGDSAEIDIEKKFENEVKVSFSESVAKPGSPISINLQAAPGSRFALSAVDRSVQLLGSTSDLRADKVMSIIERLDVAGGWRSRSKCHRYEPWRPWGRRRFERSIWWGGRSNHVDGVKALNDAGLVYFSNLDIDVKPCPKYPIMPYEFGIFEESVRDLDGSPPGAPGTSFGRRGRPGPKGPQGERGRRPKPGNRKEVKNKVQKKQPLVVRSKFPETWIWTESTIDPKTGKKTIQAKVPDTLTTWYANAFALSSNAGIGVSAPASLLVFQPFFVSLTLPYSVIRGETAEVPATVFNYLDSCLTIRLSLEASDDIKSDSYSSKVCVCGGRSSTVKFQITPTKNGKIPITVKAISTSENVCAAGKKMAQSVGAADAVKRMLRVEPEGIKKEYNVNQMFCPHKDGHGTYTDSFNLKLPSKVVPGSVYARISVYGDLMGPSLTDLDKLLAMPYGCGEQNMLKFAPNIYIMQYLTSTNQLKKDIEDKAKEYMVSGYQRELRYKRSDGSYSAFGNSDKEGSTWLSAFVLKSYAQAKKYIFIDDKEIKDTMGWLLKLQKSDGCFREVGMVHHKAMKGGVSSGISMTAYVLTALLEAGLKSTSKHAVSALSCISAGISKVSDSYSAASLAYTLTMAGSADRSKIMKTLEGLAIVGDGLKHWESEEKTTKRTSWYYKPRPADVEMTAYALMAYINGPNKNVLGAAPIIRWLAKQRNSLGGFSSTQDTCVALQALAQYGGLMYESGTKLNVKISTKELSHSFTITEDNRLVLQRVEIPTLPTKVNVEAKGKGCALLQANVKYNVPVVKEEPKFFLSISAKQIGSNCKHDIEVCASYSGKGSSNMALIDVKMVSGFEPITNHLDKILQSTEKDKILKDYEFIDNVLSLYFRKIDAKTCVSFPVEQTSVVLDRKKAHAKVYDYYNPGEFAVAMYAIATCTDVN